MTRPCSVVVVVEDALDAQTDRTCDPLEGDLAARARPVAPGKALRDNDVALLHGLPVLVPACDPAETGEPLENIGLDGRHVHRTAAVEDRHLAVGIDAADPGDGSDLGIEILGHLHVRGVRDVHVAAQLAPHPPDERFAEAADHGAQADGQGKGHHEGGYGNAGPAQVLDDVACGDPAGKLPHAAEQAPQQRMGEHHDDARQQAQSEEESEHADVGHVDLLREERENDDAGNQDEYAGQRNAPGQAAALVASRTPSQGEHGVDTGELQQGQEAPQEACPEPHDDAGGRDPPGPGHGRGPQEEVEAADRAADDVRQSPAQEIAEDAAQEAAEGSEKGDLGQEGPRDLAPACTQAPEDAGVAAAAHDGEHGRVVDQKHADEEGHERERLQVEPEGPHHGAERLLPLALGLDPVSLLPAGEKAALVGEDEIDVIDLPGQLEQLLGVSDVHEDQRLAGGVGEGSDHLEAAPEGIQHAAFREPEYAGKVLFEQDGPLIGEKGKGVLPVVAGSPCKGGPGDLGPDGPVEEGVDTQEPDEIAVGQLQPPLHDGGEGRNGRVVHEVPQDRLVQGPCETLQGVGGFPAEKLHGLGKAGESRLGRKRHPDDGGHPAGDPEELKQAEAAPPVEIA